jgi:hypothetical protein
MLTLHSEDDELSELESEEDEDEEEASGLKPIAVRDEEKTAKFANCMNCEEEFDVTANDRGDCIWHSGEWLWNF